MLKRNYIRISLVFTSVLMVVLFVLVIVKINSLNISSGAAVKAAKMNSSLNATSGDKVDDSDSPSHFSIFKFVNNFIPTK